MRSHRSASSPFGTIIYLSRSEIDEMCEDALREAKFLPEKPGPIAIDSFIESHFESQLDFGTDFGAEVMGFTLFSPKGKPMIVGVSALLCDQTKVNDRRVRTTLAHEAGHCLLHPILFMPDADTRSLVGTNVDIQNKRILCRQRDFEARGYDGRWWEVQANAAIGGFLLPKQVFLAAVAPFLEPVGSLGLKELPAGKRESIAHSLAQVFDVNPRVATIRLDHFFPRSRQAEL
jgi:hypothetical protein